MTLIKKLLIFVTLILFIIILWRLIIIRININSNEGFTSGQSAKCTGTSSMLSSITSPAKDNELCKIENSTKVTIQNVNTVNLNLPLKELCIKASYNSANSGNYISTDMLQYVINRGVRFLDFEVFYLQDTDNKSKSGTTSTTPIFKPVVAASVDPYFALLTTENTVLLDNILTTAVANAFSAPCPNYQDPLFINLRIKSNDPDIYEAVAASIDHTIKDKIYQDHNSPPLITNKKTNKSIRKALKVTSNTPLKLVMGKIILSIDKTIFPNYKNHTTCGAKVDNCYNLTNYTNIEQGSEDMNSLLYKYMSPTNTIQIKDDNKTTNVKTMVVANPDNDFLAGALSFNSPIKPPDNPDYGEMLLKYSSQIVPYRFYHNDSALADYEAFFNKNNSAFVPLSVAISYFKNQQQDSGGQL